MNDTDGGSLGGNGSAAKRLIGPDLTARVLSAIVLIVLAVGTSWFGGPFFTFIWLILGIAIFAEWAKLVGALPTWPLVLAFAVSYLFAASLMLGNPYRVSIDEAGVPAFNVSAWDIRAILPSILSPFSALAVGAAFILIYRQKSGIRSWLWAGFFYAGVIVIVPPLIRGSAEFGLSGIAWLFALVWSTDIAAYFCGRLIGGPKLWPAVSPKKTWAGFIGGLLFGTLAGIAAVYVAQRYGVPKYTSWGTVFGVTASASIASQLGDLGESALKRRFGVKDSGNLIPGHGGVMDRLDGFWAASLFAAVVLAVHSMMSGA